MSEDIYERLAHHLDRLPAGFYQTESGVELRILRRLFTPEQAELALHLTVLPEEARVIALRAGMPVEQTRLMLDEMGEKGLLTDMRIPGKPPQYMAVQFVMGIWEYQVNRLYPELVQDFDEYISQTFPFETWKATPQIRTIPIGASLPDLAEVLPYERAEKLVRRHHRFSLAECICRKERRLAGEGCDKPLETCLGMGGGAELYIRRGLGREITLEEALQVLEVADKAGLVLQPGNNQRSGFICCCCGDCCGVLRNVRRHPQPASVVSSGYTAYSDPQICSACGDCVARCQMEAVSVDEGFAVVDLERCIGCGLCVTTCSTSAMQLRRKPQSEQRSVPANSVLSYLQLARQRGVLKPGELAWLMVKSKIDRMRAVL